MSEDISLTYTPSGKALLSRKGLHWPRG